MLGVITAIFLSIFLFLGNAGLALGTSTNGSAFTVHHYTFGTTADGFNSNQLKSYNRPDTSETVTLTYDADGSRASRVVKDVSNVVLSTDTFSWDQDNRLIALNLNSGPPAQHGSYQYLYDARTRRVLRDESAANGATTRITYLGGTSIAETTVGNTTAEVEYVRANGMGGGIGSILYSHRTEGLSTSHYNSRGDVIARANLTGSITYTAAYEAFGTHESETGTNPDRQQANTKEEDPTGLLNEGFRYRDLETGMFISRDPAGFVDGPNVYTYVQQNPWTGFDPEGLEKVPMSAYFLGYRPSSPRAIGPNNPQGGRILHLTPLDQIGLETHKQAKIIAAKPAVRRTAKVVGGVGEVFAGVTPYVGDALDAKDVVSTNSSNIERGVASVSLGVNAWTAGLAPNAGPIRRGAMNIFDGFFGKLDEASSISGKTAKATTAPVKPAPCFPEGTRVSTPDGDVEIQDIEDGDVVFAYNFDSGEVVERKVIKTFKNFTYYWVDIDLGTEVVTATRKHRFWVESEKDWLAAIDLKKGMTVRSKDGGIRAIRSVSLRELEKPEDTFNLEVEQDHNYFVGTATTLVHNGDFEPKEGRDTIHGSKRAAMREAKRRSGVPTSHTHTTHRTVRDAQVPGKTVTEYDFDVGKKDPVTIPDHNNGHPKGNVPPHFNDTGKGHHIYEGC